MVDKKRNKTSDSDRKSTTSWMSHSSSVLPRTELMSQLNDRVSYVVSIDRCYIFYFDQISNIIYELLLHGELPQRRHGGEHLLYEIFYAGNGKWLNALQFLRAEEEYKPR